MSDVNLNCPHCDSRISIHVRDGEYRDWHGADNVPVEHVDEIDGKECYCDGCRKTVTIMARVATVPKLRIGFEL